MNEKQQNILKKVCMILGITLVLLTVCVIFDLNVDRSGWYQNNGAYSYRDFHGRKVTGWLKQDDRTYFLGDDAVMVIGWQEIDGKRYYFDGAGVMATHWKNVDNRWYYFGAEGALHTGWLELDGKKYYLDAEKDGAMVSGWLHLYGSSHYFGEDGTMLLGWHQLDGKTYYFGEHGSMYTGRITMDGSQYYFRQDGTLFTGWEETEDGMRYYTSDGPQAFGWTQIDGKLYFFSQEGWMQTGWMTVGEYHFYLQEDGSAAVGPVTIDGQLHHFSPKGIHVVLVHSTLKVPDYYKADLVTYTGWHQVARVALEPLQKMLEDCAAAGYEYEFNSAYRSVKEQQDILSLRTQEHIAIGYTPEEAFAEARRTVALPGTSEHHLGLAVDILNVKNAQRQALDWLAEHCWEYGFIVRYAEEKSHITGIISEPWHFRYVGTEVSMDMKDSGLCLEEYLGAV